MKKQAFNPYLPGGEYIPDGEPYVFDGRVYVYGSHDRAAGEIFCLNDYVTWSAPVDDLGDWRYEGVIFRKNQDPRNPEGIYPLFAPDMARGADGRFYLYYAPAGIETMGVAVCDSPCGKFEFLGHIEYPDGRKLGLDKDDPMTFDPGVLVDDDGRVWLYFGSDPTVFMPPDTLGTRKIGSFVVELASDMHTIVGEPQPLVINNIAPPEEGQKKGHAFFEASSMRKINGKYYFVYSPHCGHELCYAVGDCPTGPFEYGGVLHSNGDVGIDGRKTADRLNYTGNNHGSLVEINGQWYIFGHRMTHASVFSRQPVAEPVTILPDGSIPQAEMTSCGLNGGPLRGVGRYEARIACILYAKEGAQHVDGWNDAEEKKHHPRFTQDEPDFDDWNSSAARPRQYVGNLLDGSVVGYRYFTLGQATKISAVTRGDGGKLKVYTDLNAAPVAEIAVAPSPDWQESEAVPFNAPSGRQPLYFVAETAGHMDLDSFELA